MQAPSTSLGISAAGSDARWTPQLRLRGFIAQANQATPLRMTSSGGATRGAVAANFKAGDDDVELAIALDLALQAVKKVALEFHDLPAPKAGHVNMVALRTPLVKMFFPFHVHEIQFINEAVAFEKIERAVHGDPIDLRIELAGATENLASVQVLFSSFDDAENGAPLPRHAQAPRHQFGLQASWSFGLR